MKILRVSIAIILIILYGYSAYMTKVNPECIWWGYFCAIIFAVLAIIGVYSYLKSPDSNSEKNQ
jgi:hypothetical protein